MGDRSSIEWTDATWNPIRGCTRVSEGCRNCYAERLAARFSRPGDPFEGLAKWTASREPRWTGKVITVEHHLKDPIRWKDPRRIFVNSMSDLFHEALPFDDVLAIIDVMRQAPQHIYQILTKRPVRMQEFFTDVWGEIPPANWWLGVSAEDQETAVARIPVLQNTPATVRWVSLEPLLGPIVLGHDEPEVGPVSWLAGIQGCDPPIDGIDWVVVGGESGPGARPMHPAWARSIRDECTQFRTPFFFKQWGEWAPVFNTDAGLHKPMQCFAPDGTELGVGDGRSGMLDPKWEERGGAIMTRQGKHLAGRVLDGREWNEYPKGEIGGAHECSETASTSPIR